jgi:hypothetical protein
MKRARKKTASHHWLILFSPSEKAAFKQAIVQSAHESLRTDSNWQADAIHRLHAMGLRPWQAIELVKLAERRA